MVVRLAALAVLLAVIVGLSLLFAPPLLGLPAGAGPAGARGPRLADAARPRRSDRHPVPRPVADADPHADHELPGGAVGRPGRRLPLAPRPPRGPPAGGRPPRVRV